jgi:hypothetical protein
MLKYYDYRAQRLWFVGSEVFSKTLRGPDIAPMIMRKFCTLPNLDADTLSSAAGSSIASFTGGPDGESKKAPQRRFAVFDEVNAVHALIINLLSPSLTLQEQLCCRSVGMAVCPLFIMSTSPH